MSIRGYLIQDTEIKRVEEGKKQIIKTQSEAPTFNCWHDWDLLQDIADTERYDGEGGELIIYKTSAEEKLKEVNEELKTATGEELERLKLDAEILADILKDIKKTGDEYAEYDCY